MTTGRRRRTVAVVAAVIPLLGGGPPPAGAQGAWETWSEASPVAVLLFSNYTETSEAVDTVMPQVYRELDVRRTRYISHDELRPVLREHRIRSLGGLTAEEAHTIRRDTGAGLLLLGTLDVFEGEFLLEVSVSARVVAIDGMEILAAESVAATSEDFAGLFGAGRLLRVRDLSARVVGMLFDGLAESLSETSRTRPKAARIAVVPFDNSPDARLAGNAVSSILTSELVQSGFSVVEPGLVRGLARQNGEVLRGAVGYPMLAQLVDVLDVDFVVTGDVAEFRVARGDAENAAPKLGFGARLIDARERRLVFSFDESRSGRDGELLFGMGRTFALGKLIRTAAEKLVRRIEERAPHDFGPPPYEGSTP